MTAKLSETKSGNLVQTFTLPDGVRHPATGFDSAPTFATLTTKNASRTVKHKKVGALESICVPGQPLASWRSSSRLRTASSRT